MHGLHLLCSHASQVGVSMSLHFEHYVGSAEVLRRGKRGGKQSARLDHISRRRNDSTSSGVRIQVFIVPDAQGKATLLTVWASSQITGMEWEFAAAVMVGMSRSWG